MVQFANWTRWLRWYAIVVPWILGCGQNNPSVEVKQGDESKIHSNDRNDSPEWKSRANALLDANDTDGAIALLSDVIATDAANVEALLLRAEASLFRGELEASLADSDAALLVDSKSADVWHYKGLALSAQGHAEAALNAFNSAVDLGTENPNVYLNRGGIHAAFGRPEEALGDFATAIALDANDARAYGERGRLFQSLGKTEDAERDFTQAIALEPTNPHYYVLRGVALAKRSKFLESLKDVNEAIRLAPESPEGYERRAEVFVRKGDYVQAIPDLLSTIERTPDDAGANYKPLADQPPSDEALRHGEEQLKAMLRDRPEMAEYCKPGDAIWTWASRKLAGEDVKEPVYWDPLPLKHNSARHFLPSQGIIGHLQISDNPVLRGDGDGSAFESLWSNLVFELHNMASARQFDELHKNLESGAFSRDEFVVEKYKIERQAQQKSRAFYAHVFLPWAIESGFQKSEPAFWQHAVSATDEQPITPSQLSSNYVAGLTDNYAVDLARSEYEAGKFQESRARLEAIVAGTPTLEDDELAQAYDWLGASQLALDDESGALESFKRACALDVRRAGEFFFPPKSRVWYSRTTDDETVQTAGAYLLRCRAWAESGDFDLALADISKAIELDRNFIAAYLQRAQIYYDLREYEKSLADVEVALAASPQHFSAMAWRGQVYAAMGEDDKAFADLDAVIKVDPSHSVARIERASIYFDRGEFAASIHDLDHVLSNDVDNVDAYHQRLYVLRAQKEHKKALADVEEIVKRMPDDPAALCERGETLCELGDFSRALDDANTAIKFDSEQFAGYAVRAEARRAQGDFAGAASDLDEAVRLAPESFFVYGARARLLSECPIPDIRDTKRAVEDATKGCELTEWKDREAISTLAACYAEAGDFAKAVEWQTKAVELARGDWKEQFQHDLRVFQAGRTIRQDRDGAGKTD